MVSLYLPIICLVFLHLLGICSAAKFTLVNQCTYTVWPATLSGAGTPPLSGNASGFSLPPGATSVLSIPRSWSGRVWARTVCSTGQEGNFSCVTGDCATGSILCSGSGAIPPATLAEFTLNGSDGLDFYDVSLVDGYNLPMMVRPVGGSGNCSSAGCQVDLNGSCPAQLRVSVSSAYSTSTGLGQDVACRSACEAFGDPQYCCSGAYATPDKCKPSTYSEFFKAACPTAYSYAYDDATSTFTCSHADYLITFCPSASLTGKSSGTLPPGPEPSFTSEFLNASSFLIPSLPMIGVLIMAIWSTFSQICY